MARNEHKENDEPKVNNEPKEFKVPKSRINKPSSRSEKQVC